MQKSKEKIDDKIEPQLYPEYQNNPDDFNYIEEEEEEEEYENEEKEITLNEVAHEFHKKRHLINMKHAREEILHNNLNKVTQSDSNIAILKKMINKQNKDMPKQAIKKETVDQITQTKEVETTSNDDNNLEKEQEIINKIEENEVHIDTQIERIEEAIDKLKELTSKCQRTNYFTNDDEEISEQAASITEQTNQKRAKKKKITNKLSAAKQIKLRQNKLKVVNQGRKLKKKKSSKLKIPTGTAKDPIILRTGYPIIFDYEPKEPIRREKMQHGPMKTYFKNGDLKTEFRDGTIRIRHHNHIHTYYPNGDKQLEFADGANAYRYSKNGSVEFRCRDGELIYFFPNGQIEEHLSNGQTKIRFPDRSQMTINEDKTCIFIDKKGHKTSGRISIDPESDEESNIPLKPEGSNSLLQKPYSSSILLSNSSFKNTLSSSCGEDSSSPLRTTPADSPLQPISNTLH